MHLNKGTMYSRVSNTSAGMKLDKGIFYPSVMIAYATLIAEAHGSGVGTLTAEGFAVKLASADASGIGLATADGVAVRIVIAHGSGIGTAEATGVLTLLLDALGSGVGTMHIAALQIPPYCVTLTVLDRAGVLEIEMREIIMEVERWLKKC